MMTLLKSHKRSVKLSLVRRGERSTHTQKSKHETAAFNFPIVEQQRKNFPPLILIVLEAIICDTNKHIMRHLRQTVSFYVLRC
jgi:hypothetical protein